MKNEKELMNKLITRYDKERYTDKEEVKTLYRKIKRPCDLFAYMFGIVSALVVGFGMCLVMTDIGSTLKLEHEFALGIVFGVIGMIGAIVNYHIYKMIFLSRKKKYAQEIINLNNKIMKG